MSLTVRFRNSSDKFALCQVCMGQMTEIVTQLHGGAHCRQLLYSASWHHRDKGCCWYQESSAFFSIGWYPVTCEQANRRNLFQTECYSEGASKVVEDWDERPEQALTEQTSANLVWPRIEHTADVSWMVDQTCSWFQPDFCPLSSTPPQQLRSLGFIWKDRCSRSGQELT